MEKRDCDEVSSSDDSLLQEINALSQSCKPLADTASSSVGNAGGLSMENDDDDTDDDLEFVRSIQERFGTGSANITPLTTLPPFVPGDDDDDDADFELLASIKKRFSKNGGDGVSTSRVDETPTGNTAENDVFEQQPSDSAKEDSSSGFPKAAEMFMETIKRNRFLQKFIRNKMLHIEAKIEELNEICKRLKTICDFKVQCKKKIGRALSQKTDPRVQLIALPKHRAKPGEKNISPMCYGPEGNSYVSTYRAVMEKLPTSFHQEKWSEKDRVKLEKGIIQQYQERILQRSVHVASAAEGSGSTEGVDEMISLLRNHDITPEILQEFASEVNWEQLAKAYLPRRSGPECEARWIHHENRLNKKGSWTADEDKKLLILIELYGVHNWSCVTGNLGTNRTPFQCLARYQRSLNASILKRAWTVDEDTRLRAAVETYGECNWQVVASVLDGRTGTQCSNRWKKTLHPSREKVGKWSADEDKHLRVAVTLFGKSWHKISQFVPGRTQVQCRERWVNVLDPSLNLGEWTQEEVDKLMAAIDEHKYCWSKVAACVMTRTDSQCRRKWEVLFPDQASQLRAARSLQKTALISNFVDREVDRPALGPSDFVWREGPVMELGNDVGPQESERSSFSLKRRKDKGIAVLPDTGSVCEIKNRKTCKSVSMKKIRDKKLKKQFEKISCESTGSEADIDAWEIPIKIYSRRARGVRSKLNEESTEWEDLPLSVVFNEPLTRSRKIP